MLLRFDPDRRFTCGQCGRCCRRGRVALTPAEAERYRATGVERLYRQETGLPAVSAFETVGGRVVIRAHTTGACGFLLDDDRCAIHAELGAAAKPLTCRMFPFSVHPLDGETVVTASASCTAVAGHEGLRLGDQAAEVRRLAKAWAEAHPAPEKEVVLAGSRRLDAATARLLREKLEQLLLRPDGNLRENLGLVAQRLDDLTRHRVARLDDDAFRDYAALTLGHAIGAPRGPLAPVPKGAHRVVRAVLSAALSTRDRFAHPERGAFGRALVAARVLAHLHGLAPDAAGFDLKRARGVARDPAAPALEPLARAYLLSAVRTLGAGPGTVVEELSLAAAVLHVALLLAGDASGHRGATAVTASDLRTGLTDASDVLVASDALGRGLRATVSGPDVLYLVAAGG